MGLPDCFWCAKTQIYQTRWVKGEDGFWRCSWGHLADVGQVKTIEAEVKKQKEDAS